MMVQFIEKKLFVKSTPQIKFMNTILQDIDTTAEDFIFYFDRLAALIIEQ
jgi:uridine kinase